MKPRLSLPLLASLLLIPVSGCARFSTHQTDNRYEAGKIAGKIETKATSFTFFSSKSRLTQFHASQTEKTQSAKVGALDQQGATNTVGVLGELTSLLREMNKLKTPLP